MTPHQQTDPVFELLQPTQPLPLVFDSPHSGRVYPADFRAACPEAILRRAEDNHVDELFSGVTGHGASLLCALFPRTYIDVNRAATDLDPDLLPDDWTDPVQPTKRAHAGIGLIRRLVRPGLPVYDRRLSASEIRNRLDRYYHPYHAALAGLIDTAHYNFGQVWHINCHSMPAPPAGTAGTPDFVIGDRDGTSSGKDFTEFLYQYLKGRGYRVVLNHPYKGVEILRRHGDPARGRHSLQLEVSKSLYWDETRNQKSSYFNSLRKTIEEMAEACATYAQDQLPLTMAAD